jgi:P4 family phage/plasmid primase-like protien
MTSNSDTGPAVPSDNGAPQGPARRSTPKRIVPGRGSSDPACKEPGQPPSPEFSVSVRFLSLLAPQGPWCLSIIGPKRGQIRTRTFLPGQEAELLSWLETNRSGANCYFTVNRVREPRNIKPSRDDILEVGCLHVDIDPRAGEPLAEEQARIRALVLAESPAGLPRPTFVIFSGGGYQALWRLRTSLPLEAAEAVERATAYNLEIRNRLGGDSCQSIDHLLRLPGTVNWPDEKKRRRGQAPTLATLEVAALEAAYELRDFPTPPHDHAGQDRSNSRPRVAAAHVRVVGSIDALPDSVPDTLKQIVLHGHDPGEPSRFPSRSHAVWFVTNGLLRCGLDDASILGVLLNPAFGISAHVLDQPQSEKYAARQVRRAREGPPLVNVGTPMLSAQVFRDRERPHLTRFRSDWLDYDGSSYRIVEDDTITSELYSFLAKAKTLDEDGKPRPFHPNQKIVQHVRHALAAVVHVEGETREPPCWLVEHGLPPRELIACKNGLLHLPTGDLLPPTPDFFTRNAVSIAFDRGAPMPSRWIDFLHSIWPSDAECIDTLQEMFGYLLVPDTSQQKMFLLVGPKRSGKGTIGRTLTELVGAGNVCGPSLASLSGEFGLQQLLGKQLAVVSDMRLGPRTDQAAIAENLLRISGEDIVSVNRKNRDFWTGTLSTRFLIMSNVLPRFADASGALANRFIPLVIRESFYGRENPNLSYELRTELPGILCWARKGWLRLKQRGRFILPSSSHDAVQDLVDLAAPIAAFVRERCELDPNARVGKDDLFQVYRSWSMDRGSFRTLSKEVFCADLLAAFQGVSSIRPRVDGDRPWMFQGLRIRGALADHEADQGTLF